MKNYKLGVVKLFLLMVLFTQMLFSINPVRIMPLGDSITHENYRDNKYNVGGSEEILDVNRTAYRKELLNLLQIDNYSVDFVGSLNSGSAVMPDADHEGHDGWTDNNITDNVFSFLTANPAEVVLLHIGTNGDIADDSAADVNATLEKIDHYEIANNTHIKVVLARIIDCWDGWDAAAATPAKTLVCTPTFKTHIQNFNTNLDAMVTSRVAAGDDITVVDMQTGAGLDYNATDMIDDLHPNVTGYAKMANAWYTALETVIPTHQWKLDETIDPYADTYRDANGTCVANCPVSVTGQIGSGQRFDGSDDEIELAYNNSYDWNRTDSFTVSFWMNAATGGISTTEVIIGRDDRPTTNVQWWVGYDATTGYVKFSLIDSNNVHGSIENTTHVVNDGLWHHVTFVRDGTANTDTIYVDGVLGISAPSAAFTGDFSIANKGITLGNLSPTDNFDYNGSLDEVTIFNAALSADQVKQLHSQGLVNFSITTTPATTAATVDIAYLYDVNTSNDVDAQGNFSLTNAIGNMAIDVDGIFTWTPAAMVNTQVSIEASDGTRSDTQVLDLKARFTDKLPAGMAHYWQLDEVNPVDKTYLDANNSATPGTDALCNTGCPTQVPGQVGNAQDFSAVVSPDLNISDDNSFDWAAGDSFTIELWMNPTTLGQHNIPLGRRASTGDMGWRIGSNPANNVEISFQDTNNIEVVLTGNTVNAATWYHIAVVRDTGNDTFTLYVNGEEVNSTTDTSTGNFSASTPITMANFVNNVYDGLMDDVAIFNTILSANDIKAHYNNGLVGNGFENHDLTAPVITLVGANPQTLTVGASYTELNATANDDVDGNITANIVIDSSAVNMSAEGNYTVTYDVNDTAGNVATQVTRTVNVIASTLYTYQEDGNTSTYTSVTGGTNVVIDSVSSVQVVEVDGKVIFTKTDASGKEAYIEMLSDGSLATGYRTGTTSDSPTTVNGFLPGTKARFLQDNSDVCIFIVTTLERDLNLGGTL